MAVNLLPQVTEKDLQKVDTNIRGFIGLIIWGAIIVVVFVILFLVKGVETGTVRELESQKTIESNRIVGLNPLTDDYYTLAYKTSVLNYVKTQQYKPTVIEKYIDKQLADKATISQYSFDSAGNISLGLTAPSYLEAMRIWDLLLRDKTVFNELSLNSFSQDESGIVFQLKGRLNLTELYKQNGSSN